MKRDILINLLNKLPNGVSSSLIHNYFKGKMKKYADINVEGYEKIKDEKGPFIFICNHLSNSDALILNEILKDKDPAFAAGIKLENNKFTASGFKFVKTIPIKPNSADKDAIVKMVSTLREGHNIMIFPEGTRSREAKMLEAKKGLLLIARLSKARIAPIGMWGTEKFLPINDKDMEHEQFGEAKIEVRFGEPISVPVRKEGEDKKEYEKRAMDEMMKSVAVLLPEGYRGYYSNI